jgi:hypothetical protein
MPAAGFGWSFPPAVVRAAGLRFSAVLAVPRFLGVSPLCVGADARVASAGFCAATGAANRAQIDAAARTDHWRCHAVFIDCYP